MRKHDFPYSLDLLSIKTSLKYPEIKQITVSHERLFVFIEALNSWIWLTELNLLKVNNKHQNNFKMFVFRLFCSLLK